MPKSRGLPPVVAILTMLIAGILSQSCAPVRVVISPGEDYVFPVVEGERLSVMERKEIESAWRDVLRGSVSSAEKRFLRLLRGAPSCASVETGLAFARLRGQRLEAAERTFGSVIARHPRHVPALIGAASTAVRLNRSEQALDLYRRALEIERDESTQNSRLIRKRLSEVKMRITERRVAAAQEAVTSGDTRRAREEYEAALAAAPELVEVRVTLADLMASDGDLQDAVIVLAAAPEADQAILLRMGELHSQLGEHESALLAFRRALERDRQNADVQRRVAAARNALELDRQPEEYRRIQEAPHITRADLAALVSVKITALARQEAGQPAVATDISGSWAKDHVIRALSYGILGVYPNHSFQPAAVVRRAEMARAVTRVLDLFDWPSQPAPVISDMSTNNLYHRDASRAVAAGLLDLTRTGAFEPWRPVSGRDAMAVIEALARLVGP
ncbi:MAG: tetratricopeptide repeat protein [Vicinamibacteria bacterium]|nr:tetratricopeptide repeat protein [Vicinamibacteria bacterium]